MRSILLIVFTIINIKAFAQPWLQQLKDACPGACDAESFDHTAYNGTVFYQCDDGTHGSELWATDGTAANTRMVKDIDPGPVDQWGSGHSFPIGFTNVNGKLVFCAFEHNSYRYFVWATDGTDAGTKRLANNITVDNLTNEIFFMPYGQNAYFIFNNSGYLTLAKTNGTDTGTYSVKPLYYNVPSSTGSDINDYTFFNNKLCFAIGDLPNIYMTDGTNNGTTSLFAGRAIKKMISFQNMLYGITDNYKLFKTDGTTSSMSLVADFINLSPKIIGTMFTTPTSLVIVNSKIWTSDGTPSGTTALNAPPVNGQTPVMIGYKLYYFTGIQPQLYLAMADVSNGTSAIVDTTVTSFNTSSGIKIIQGKLYFQGAPVYTAPDGSKSSGKHSLYTYEPTQKQMKQIPEIITNNIIYNTAIIGNDIILCGNDSVSGYELWKITDFPIDVHQIPVTDNRISLYPNPAHDMLTLTSPSNTDVSYRIVNIYGQVVLHGNTVYSKQIDISALPAAVYNIIIQTTNEETITRRFVKL